jgi:hypothetical protein
MPVHLTPAQRFWSKVNISNPDKCWMWQGPTSGNGYGNFTLKINGKFKTVQSHRFGYELLKGKIPEEMLILHKCDIPLCVNPNHLRPGTQKENIKDSILRNRRVKPILGKRKFNMNQANEIRNKYEPFVYGFCKLANEYGVAPKTIRDIVNNKHYKK